MSAEGEVNAAFGAASAADQVLALALAPRNQHKLTLAGSRRVLQSGNELSAEEFERQF